VVTETNCASCGARFRNGDHDKCPACRTRKFPAVKDPSKDAARVEAIWLRYGKSPAQSPDAKPYVVHRDFCFFAKMRVCTCGLLADLLEIVGNEAHDVHPRFFEELHVQLEVLERLGG